MATTFRLIDARYNNIFARRTMVSVLKIEKAKSSMSFILETKDVSKRFGAVIAAHQLNVKLAKNTILGLIGSNGAGKTTFLNIITGFIKPDTGSVYFFDNDITGENPREITKLGVCRSFQIPQLFDSMTVEENLMVSAVIRIRHFPSKDTELNRPPKHLVKIAIRRFHLEKYKSQKAVELPEGIRKLVDIAMAIILNPKLLLLDEPTSGLSGDEKFEIMDMIMNVVRSDEISALFVEHDMEIIKKYTDETLAFYNGTIMAQGKTNEVLSNAKVRRLILGESY